MTVTQNDDRVFAPSWIDLRNTESGCVSAEMLVMNEKRGGRGGKWSQSGFGLFVSGCLQAERNLYSVLGLTLS